MGYSMDEDIPLEAIKKEIFRDESRHKRLLCMFCCADHIVEDKGSIGSLGISTVNDKTLATKTNHSELKPIPEES